MSKLADYIEENFPEIHQDILLADGFEDAFIGVATSYGSAPKACYNYDVCIDILMRDMDEGEAIEFMEFNVTSAYVGEFTPAFIKLMGEAGDLPTFDSLMEEMRKYPHRDNHMD